MNAEIQSATPAPINPRGRSGRIVGFITNPPDYLDRVRADLALPCTAEELEAMRTLFVSLGHDPTVDELIFALGTRGAALRRAELVRVDAIRGDDPEAAGLFTALMTRCAHARPRSPLPPTLTELAAFAALQGKTDGRTKISVCPRTAPTAPVFTGHFHELYATDRLFVSVSDGGRRTGAQKQYAALIYPPAGMPAEVFFPQADELTLRHYDRAPDALILPLTRRGLLPDLTELCAPVRLNADVLPAPLYGRCMIPLTPALLVFSERGTVRQIGSDAELLGLGCCFALSGSSGKSSAVAFGRETIPLTPAFLRGLLPPLTRAETLGEPALTASAPVVASPVGKGCRKRVTAEGIGGRSAAELFSSLDAALARAPEGAALALCGTLVPGSGSAVPTILVLDAIARKYPGRVRAAQFTAGTAASLDLITVE